MFDVNRIRNDFPMIRNNPNLIYFDSGATSFKPQCVIDEVRHYYEHENSNIHRGDYDISFRVSRTYDDTRKTVARFINAQRSDSIVFTYGSTSSLNTVAINFGKKFLKNDDVILTSKVEHASDILPW
ncbi:MAG: aminotransferase class V-fold PLP-dependent enzyme, partial [Erysipelotrichaceae bacterium]|nr:aminotransferase class V-fold PLP-dependent enzyme [Erysipelotrichaceae bacterium]